MREDREGFLYPTVDTDICIECGLCEKVCPVIHVAPEIKKAQTAYIFQSKDDDIRQQSTSGGAFTAIGNWVISQRKGVVFGAAFDENFVVKHRFVETIEKLRIFRNSKYVQSQIGKAYQQAKEFLESGRWVCFSGTPCQIEGLVCYLRKPYTKLLLVDLVCRAVPSPLVLRKYLDMQHIVLGTKFGNILFRDKHYGYKYSTFSIYNNKNEKIYYTGVDKDVYLRAFFSNISPRPSCFSCQFKKQYRISDFTLWDCFDVVKFNKNFDDDKGTTRILAHSPMAEYILQELEPIAKICKIPVDKAVEGVRELTESVLYNDKRDAFFLDVNNMPPMACFQKYFPTTIKVRIEHIVRYIGYKLGIYQSMKKVYKIFFKNKANQKN